MIAFGILRLPMGVQITQGRLRSLLALLAVLSFGPARIGHAQNLLLKLPNTTGSSVIKDHEGWIPLKSSSIDLRQTASGGSSNPEFFIDRQSDGASPIFAQAVATGTNLGTATIHLVGLSSSASAEVLYNVTLTDVVLTYWHQAAGQQGLLEGISMKFGKLTIEVPIRNANGNTIGAASAAIQPGVAALAPQLIARGEWTAPGNYRLWWPAKGGSTYQVLSSPTLSGTYSLVREVSPAETGDFNVDIASPTPQQFFRIIEKAAP